MDKIQRMVLSFLKSFVPKKPRDIVEWCEEELILATGPKKGEALDLSYSPYTLDLVRLYQGGKYRRFFCCGSVQSGKTLISFTLPVLYYLFERGEDVIILAPTMQLAMGVWRDKLYPTIRANPRLSKMIPEDGAGSRGGEVSDNFRFKNGSTIRFITAGGSDAQRSSHTARVICITEADKMWSSSVGSAETDPLRQGESRSASFGDRALLFAESTITSDKGRLYSEINDIGTGTKVYLQCPHCKDYLYPTKEMIVGWEEESDIMSASRNTRLECPHCMEKWTEEDRISSLQTYKFVHRGQKIEKGEIIGETPDTNTFGLTYTIVHSPLVTLSYIGETLWRSAQEPTKESKRYISQFLFSEPYDNDDSVDITSTTSGQILRHIGDYSMGEVPSLSEFCVASCDIQKKWMYLMVVAYDSNMTGHIVHYQVVDIVKRNQQEEISTPTPAMVINALNEADGIMSAFNPVSRWIDIGYTHEADKRPIIRDWIKSKGIGYNAVMGRAETQMHKMSGSKMSFALPQGDSEIICPKKQDDGIIIWFLNTDALKDRVHAAIQAPSGTDGTIYFPKEIVDNANRWVIRHLTSEERTIQYDRRGIETRKWINPAGKRNDLFDCLVYNYAGALVYNSIYAGKKISKKVEKKDDKVEEKVITNEEKPKQVKQENKRSYQKQSGKRFSIGI